MSDRDKYKTPMMMKETTEQGDVAKALQSMLETHYISKDFYDLVGSTSWSKTEALYYCLLNIQRNQDAIDSMKDTDVSEEMLSILPKHEQERRKEMWRLKQRFMENPTAISFSLYDAFMYMMALSFKSVDGMTLQQGVNISGRGTRAITDGSNMGTFQKLQKRLFGNIAYYDE